MSDIRTVVLDVERTVAVTATLDVDFEEIREWLAESGDADEEITDRVVKDFLESGDEEWKTDMRERNQVVDDNRIAQVVL